MTLPPGRELGSHPADLDVAPEITDKRPSADTGLSSDVRGAATAPDVVRQRGAWVVLLAMVVAAAVVAAVWLTAFQGDSSSSSVLPDAPATKAVPPAKTEEQKIVDTYLGYFEAQGAALDAADPTYPALADYATGTQLQVVKDAVQKVRDQGWQTRNPPDSVAAARVTVETIEGDHATFRSCELEDGFVVRADTGEPLAPSRVSTSLWTGELVRERGTWKVSYATAQSKWEGVAGCWLGQ